MGNNGYSRDKKIVCSYLYGDKLVPILETDNYYQYKIKTMVNNLIQTSELKVGNYMGYKYHYSTGYGKGLSNLLYKINRFRIKNWYWDPINAQLLINKRKR